MHLTFWSYPLILLAGSLALLLPGLALQVWLDVIKHGLVKEKTPPFSKPDRRDALERIAETLGVSIAVNALLALVLFMVDIRLSAWGLAGLHFLLVLMISAGVIFRNFQRRYFTDEVDEAKGPAIVSPQGYAHDSEPSNSQPYSASRMPLLGWIAALLVFGLLIAWRVYQARTLVLPAWVDSLHHVLIVRKMLEYGGLPPDLNPYLPVPFFYHYAFHSLSAVFSFWSRLSADQGVLILGQIINAAVSLSVYRLAKALWGDVRRAAAAMLLVTFFAHMPGYYLTWGRYTLLTGLILLPLAMASALQIARGGSRPAEYIRLAVLTAGLLLAHYLAALLLALFWVVLAIWRIWQDLNQRKISFSIWAGWIGSSLAGLVLAMPWLLRVWQYSRSNFRVDVVISDPAVETYASPSYLNYLWYLLGPQRNHFLLILAGVGLLLVLRNRPGRLLAAWSLLIGLLSLPWGVRLGPFRPDHFTILLFLPMGILVGDLLVRVSEALGRVRTKTWEWAALFGLVIGMGIWGIKETRNILNPVTILATEDDYQALEWITANTPEDARFFINAVPWQGGSYRGVDGGAWILPLTGRWSLVPTQLYVWGLDGYEAEVSHWVSQAPALSLCSDSFWDLVNQAELTHIYIKTGQGSLQPGELKGCPELVEAFHNDRVAIYQVSRSQ